MMKSRYSVGDWIFDTVNVTMLLLMTVAFIFPFYVVVINSFTAEKFLTSTTISFWPKEISLEAYKILINPNGRIVRAFFVSISSVLLGTMQALVVTTLFAYAMAKEKFPFKSTIMVLVIFTMMFSGGLIPTYLMFQAIGLTNTFYMLMVFHVFNVGFMIFIRNYFMTIPTALQESARIDGAHELTILWRIMLPIAKPMIAAMGLFIAVGLYNDWMNPMFYIRNEKLFTLQLILKNVMSRIDTLAIEGTAIEIDDLLPVEAMKMATIVITVSPILFSYPFVQKYFMTGMWTGAMKE